LPLVVSGVVAIEAIVSTFAVELVGAGGVLAHQVAESFTEGAGTLAQRDPARYVNHRHVTHLPSCQLYAH